jgi:excisionase family DNA binding protein
MHAIPPDESDTLMSVSDLDEIIWMSTQAAARRLGITTRTLYRFVDEGSLPAYKMGRVFRLKRTDVDQFIERSRIAPGSLEHLYPERKSSIPVPADT